VHLPTALTVGGVSNTLSNTVSYSKEYMATTNHDINVSAAPATTTVPAFTNAGIIYQPSASLDSGNNSIFKFKLSGGAKFGNPLAYKLLAEGNDTVNLDDAEVGAVVSTEDGNATLVVLLSKPVVGNKTYTLTTETVNDKNDYSILIPKGATSDVSLSVEVTSGGTAITANNISEKILTAKSTIFTTKIEECKKREINSEDLTKLDATAAKVDNVVNDTNTEDRCDIATDITPLDIDFAYVAPTTPANNVLTYTISGPMTQLATTNPITWNNKITPLTKSGNDYKISLTGATGNLNIAGDANTTIELVGNADIIDAQYTLKAVIDKVEDPFAHNTATPGTPVAVELKKEIVVDENIHGWFLNIYRATVLDLRHNLPNGRQGVFTLFNTSDKAASASVKLTSPTGVETEIKDIVSVPANGSAYITTGMLTGMVNGSSIVVTLPVIAQYGDMVAMDQRNFGLANMKVVDNNGNNNGN
jgi:hypothetical protein